jgi:hypothetical protein
MSMWSTAGGDYGMTSMEADPDGPEPEPDEPEPEEYDPGPEVDDEGGMSEYRHYAEWSEIDRAEYELEAGL